MTATYSFLRGRLLQALAAKIEGLPEEEALYAGRLLCYLRDHHLSVARSTRCAICGEFFLPEEVLRGEYYCWLPAGVDIGLDKTYPFPLPVYRVRRIHRRYDRPPALVSTLTGYGYVNAHEDFTGPSPLKALLPYLLRVYPLHLYGRTPYTFTTLTSPEGPPEG